MKKTLAFFLALILVATLIPTPARALGGMVYAKTALDLENAIESNTTIVLSAGTYSLEYGLWIYDIENLEIIGSPGTRIISADADDEILSIWYCRNIHISNVAFGYNLSASSGYGSGDAWLYYSKNVTLDNCELSGYGRYGFAVDDCTNVKFNNCAVKNASTCIGVVYDCFVEFNGCRFTNNGFDPDMSEYYNGALYLERYYTSPLATFNNCVFENNKSENFKVEISYDDDYDYTYDDYYDYDYDYDYGYNAYKTSYNLGYTRINNCVFVNNAWQLESVTPPKPPQNSPDDWAKEEVQEALDAGLVPYSISSPGWKKSTSRLAAAEAMVTVIERVTGKTMTQIADERGWNLSENLFADTANLAVTFLKYAGVATGVGDNKYDPNGTYTRAQAVTMIGRAAEEFFGKTAKGENPFTDVPSWAAPYVGYAAANNITNGVGGGKFNSNGVLQNQETAIFCLRAYTSWSVAP